MSRMEVADLLDKIQAYRQSFLITNTVLNEWSRILELYDYEDVDKKLDEYFKNGDNFGRYPDVYYLIKFLKKHDEKLKEGVTYVNCQLCQKLVDLTNYDRHYERCSSIEYLCQMSKKYFDKTLSKEKLHNASQESFENYYWDCCKRLFEAMKDDDILKQSLEKPILTHEVNKSKNVLQEIKK